MEKLSKQLNPERQEELRHDDTIKAILELLDSRIIARRARLRAAVERQSEEVFALTGTLEGYDG